MLYGYAWDKWISVGNSSGNDRNNFASAAEKMRLNVHDCNNSPGAVEKD